MELGNFFLGGGGGKNFFLGPKRPRSDPNGRFDHFGPFWSSTPSDRTAATP